MNKIELLRTKEIKEKLSKKQIDLILVLLYRFNCFYETYSNKLECYNFQFGNDEYKIARMDYEYVCIIIDCIIKRG